MYNVYCVKQIRKKISIFAKLRKNDSKAHFLRVFGDTAADLFHCIVIVIFNDIFVSITQVQG